MSVLDVLGEVPVLTRHPSVIYLFFHPSLKIQDEDGNPIIIDGLSRLFPGWSELREEIARNVETMGLTRPAADNKLLN